MSNIKGHLKIIKKYKNGDEVVVEDDHNVIVSGMGLTLNLLFSGSGSTSITDYQITKSMLGSGTGDEVSSTFGLSNPTPLVEMYTSGDSGVNAEYGTLYTTNNATSASQAFINIPHSKITRVNKNAVRYQVVIDETPLNNHTLKEIGLFSKNPQGTPDPRSVLVAYKRFGGTSGLVKSPDFSLIFNWTLTF